MTDVVDAMREGGFDAAFLAVGAQIGKRAYIPAGAAATVLDAVSRAAQHGGRGAARCSAGASSSTAAATRRSTRRGPPSGSAPRTAIVVYRRTRDRMPAHDFEVEEALEEGVVDASGSRRSSTPTTGELVVEKMELDETGFPQPTGELEELEADSVVLALGQETDLSLLDGVAGIEVEDGVVQVGPDMMTGHPGIFAGGDMVPAERTVTVGIGHGKLAARNVDAWLRGERYAAPPAARAGRLRLAQHLVLRRRAARRSSPQLELRAGASRPSTRSSAGSTSRTRSSRRAAACRAATASPATTATASAPTTP